MRGEKEKSIEEKKVCSSCEVFLRSYVLSDLIQPFGRIRRMNLEKNVCCRHNYSQRKLTAKKQIDKTVSFQSTY